MEVSNNQESPLGGELIEQLVTLTGLPNELVHNELGMILGSAGQNSGDLTLDQLRSAMLAYLESLQAEFGQEELEQVKLAPVEALPTK